MDKISAMAASHECRVATPHDSVLNSECAYTFHSPHTTDGGIVVNLQTFVGTIDSLALSNDQEEDDEKKRDAGLFVRIVKKRVEKETATKGDKEHKDEEEEEEDKENKNTLNKPTKLGIGVEGGFASEDDMYETVSTYSVVLLKKNANGRCEVEAELPYDEVTKSTFPPDVAKSVDSIVHHAGLAVQQDLKAWELDDEPKIVSKYCENLPFVDNGKTISPDPSQWKCEKDGSTENLWLNLSDGYIGGGRKNWDGSGGSGGALEHYHDTGDKYPLVVKLGTITEDVDTADCFSYAKDEDCPVKIPNLAQLLARRGIKAAGLQKTVKTTAELEVELNATYAFDAITEAGAHLIPVSGPGLQGLQNLGNSCYMNSVAQLLLGGTVPELASRYGTTAYGDVAAHPLLRVKPRDAPSDLLCQTAKLSCALTSGVFANPNPGSAVATDVKSAATDPKYRLAPRMFKHVVGKDHVDFRTGHQQDAAQFLQYLLERMDRAELGAGASRLKNKSDESSGPPASSNLFAFKTTSRLVCGADGLVKYKDSAPETMLSLRIPMDAAERKGSLSESSAPEQKRHKSENADEKMEEDKKGDDQQTEVPTVTFKACIDSWSADTTVDDYRWPHLNNSVHPATQHTRFKNFPRYLIVQMQRYELGADWTPKKIEVNIDMPHEIDLMELKSTGPQEGENLVPEEAEGHADTGGGGGGGALSRPAIDEASLAQLMDMGFSYNGCMRALTAVGGSNVEAAMNWVFEHSQDPDFNDPMPEGGSGSGSGGRSQGADGGDSGVDEGVVMSLVENLGCFTADQVRAALKETGGAADRAADWLFSHMDDLDGAIAALQSKQSTSAEAPATSSTPLEDGSGKYTLVGLISHIGKHTGSGHYVAHIKKDDKWVIFNDEKVALSESPPFQHAYMYLFRRNDSFGLPNPSY